MARRKGRSGGPKEGIRRSGLGPPAAFERRQLQGSRRRGTFSPAACSITTTLEPLMFDTWASYESTRAFVTSSFLLVALRQSGPFACHPRLPYQQVRLLAGLRSAIRVCQLSPRRPLRRHRFPRLRKCLDQDCFRQRDYLRPGVFPPSLGIVRSMLGSLSFVRPAFRHRRSHRRPHVLPRRACLPRFLQDSPERGESGLAANTRDPAQTPQGDRARREQQRVRTPRDASTNKPAPHPPESVCVPDPRLPESA